MSRTASPPPRSRPPGRTRRSWWGNPYTRFGIIIFGLIAVMVVVLTVWVPGFSWWGLLLAWLVVINGITIVVYRYDKRIAGGSQTRVPELILQLLAAAGGSPAAYVAMFMIEPRHKTQKRSFQLVYWAIVAVQVVLLVGLAGYWLGVF